MSIAWAWVKTIFIKSWLVRERFTAASGLRHGCPGPSLPQSSLTPADVPQ